MISWVGGEQTEAEDGEDDHEEEQEEEDVNEWRKRLKNLTQTSSRSGGTAGASDSDSSMSSVPVRSSIRSPFMDSEASTAPPVAQTAPVDPPNKPTVIKIAAASRKKLVSPEAQRILSVLDECVRKTDLLSLIPCKIEYPEIVSRELGDAALTTLREHLRLSEKFNRMPDARARKANAIANAVQDSLRNFLRQVRHQEMETVKEVLQAAGPIFENDQKAVLELGAGLRELRHVLIERLMTMPREERERKRLEQEVRERQQRNVELLYTLEQQVREATEHRDKVISKKDEEIRRLRESLQQMERMWEEFVLQVQKKAEQQHQSDLKNSEMKCLGLREEATQLRAQLDLLTKQHRETEMALRKKNNKLETEIENWIQKYDMEMEEKQVKMERLTQAYEQEQAELRELQEHLADLGLEYSQIMEIRRQERERREEEERERQVKSDATVIIQAYWRGWKVRKAMKSKAKKKPSKKGKGKKKK
ncbi:IQ domain-containing protein D [Bagarius yarrelli]|uniref:Dynein regulatory complex protein 10 n=1 Tax=Bagarius yarrelli TaxID=175774 RepID=A0A556V1V9_BAGYA|nr:IQ domain-containing protein D [Bagarius yarrelli]